MSALRRMGRYLLVHKRFVYTSPWQEADGIEVQSDTDYPDAHRARSNDMPTWLSLITCFHFGYHHEHHE